jgi:hypothetical protein
VSDISSSSRGEEHAGKIMSKQSAYTLAVLVIAVLLQLQSFDRSIVPMDEGHLAAVASFLASGKALYRDLHSGIFPGIYQLTRLLFGVFGDDLLVTRWAEVAVNAAIATCLWLTGASLMPRGWAVVAPALYLALVPMSFPVLAMFNYSSLALAMCMASLYLLISLLDEGRRSTAIALGVTLALGVFCKQNFGALAFAAVLIGLLVSRHQSALADRSWSRILLPIAASGLAVTLVFTIHFIATGTLMDFIDATLIQLGGDQLESFNNPIPPVLGYHPLQDPRFIFLYSPPFLFNKMLHGESLLGVQIDTAVQSFAIRLSYGIALATLLAMPVLAWFNRNSRDPRGRRGVRVVGVFALLFSLGIYPSAIWSHLAFVLPPILLAMGLIAARCDAALLERSQMASSVLRVAVASLVAASSIAGIAASADIARWHSTPLDLPKAGLRVTAGQAELYRNAVAFVDRCAAADEAIFVAPYMPVVYFLTGRSNVSRYDLAIPGNVDGRRIVASLESAQTRCIVYNPVMYPEFAPFGRLFPKLSRYIELNYRTAEKIRGGGESWLGLVRKDASGPWDATAP